MKAIKASIFLTLILSLFGWAELFSQTISSSVDRNKILIGEKIILTIKVEDAKPQNAIAQWINLPDTINHFEVVDRGKIDTISVDGIINYQQIINITSFDSGQWQIPALDVQLASVSQTLSTSPIIIDVLPVDVSQLKDYHDVKEILEVQDESSRLIIIILIIVTLLAIAIVIWLLRRKKKQTTTSSHPIDNRQPLEWALAEINKLQLENLPNQGLVKQFYQRLTDISRQYFYRQLRQSAIHQTTEEWMLTLQDMQVDNETKTAFFQFLRLADIVKFAKYIPPADEHDNSINAATNMMKRVAEWVLYSANKPQPVKV